MQAFPYLIHITRDDYKWEQVPRQEEELSQRFSVGWVTLVLGLVYKLAKLDPNRIKKKIT